MQFSSDTRIWLCAVFLCYSNFLTVMPSCGPSTRSRWTRDMTFDDVEITDFVIPSVSGARPQWDCIWDCKQNPICVSVSYNLDGTCRLHSVRFKNGASSQPLTGWRHYYSEEVSDVYFIGLNDVQTEGQYVWEKGDEATFLKWESGEPNSDGGNEDCVLVKTSISSFLDFSCTRPRAFICEKVI